MLSKEKVKWMEYSNRIEHEEKCRVMMEQPGNPMGIVIEKFGDATAVGSKVLGGSTNRAMEVGANEVKFVDAMIRFFDVHEMSFRFDIIPGDCDENLLNKLSERGFAQTGFHAVTYGTPLRELPAFADGVKVRRLGDEEFDLYADLYVKSFGMPEWTKGGVALNNRLLNQEPGRTFYVAEVDGTPAAVANLAIHEGIANLAVAGTLPEFRGRGCQIALLQQRMFDAGQKEFCNLVVAQAAYLSSSMRNMQRAGLQVAYTKALWTKKRPSQ